MKFKNWIFEMAYHQDLAIEKIESLLPMLSEHILKCWIMPDSQDLQHWMDEISNWMKQMDSFADIKTKRKRISFEVFQKEFENKLKSNRINNYIKSIEFKYKVNVQNRQKLIRKLQIFLDAFFVSLSQNKFELDDMQELILGLA